MGRGRQEINHPCRDGVGKTRDQSSMSGWDREDKGSIIRVRMGWGGETRDQSSMSGWDRVGETRDQSSVSGWDGVGKTRNQSSVSLTGIRKL